MKDKKLYVGQTNNLVARLKRHNSGQVMSTKNRRPFVLIYQEPCNTRTEATKREEYFKSLYSAKLKQKILKHYLQFNNVPG